METLTNYISFSRFYGPDSCVNALLDSGFPQTKLYSFNRGDTVNDGSFRFTAVFADHTSDSIGVLLEIEGHRLYFSGDSLFHPHLYEIKTLSPEILFICINGKFGNMNWQEASQLATYLKVRSAIPMHYDMFPNNTENPNLFINSVSAAGIFSTALVRNKEYSLDKLLP